MGVWADGATGIIRTSRQCVTCTWVSQEHRCATIIANRLPAKCLVGPWLVLQGDFSPTTDAGIHVVFDVRDRPHDCALGGRTRLPKPSRCRSPGSATLPSITDAPAARSVHSRFF